jgi:hypothetical protein
MPQYFTMPTAIQQFFAKGDAKLGAEPLCPKCGEACSHTPQEMSQFANEALQEASDWVDSLKHSNYVYQYLPGFVDGDPEEAAFSTKEELLAIDWIGRWSKSPGFVRFILKPSNGALRKGRNYILFAEIANDQNNLAKTTNWVICFIRSNDGLDFPKE